MKYKCIVSYDGYSYSGYQKQKHDKNTIQEEIENVLTIILEAKDQLQQLVDDLTKVYDQNKIAINDVSAEIYPIKNNTI